MPIIANAKKALRQTKTRTTRNRVVRAKVRSTIKNAAVKPDAFTLSSLFSTLDRAVKRHIIHKNKAARLKSRAAQNAAAPEVAKLKPVVKKASKKAIAAKKKASKAAKTTKKTQK